MKEVISFPAPLHKGLKDRAEEEGTTFGAVVREACVNHVYLTDPKPKKVLPEYEQGNMERISISIPLEWLEELNLMAANQTTPGRKVSGAAVIREMVREALGKPKPEPVVRAPRNPQLSRDIIFEAQVESFNDMRNLRTSQEGQPKVEEKKVWDRIRANPDEFFHVNNCRVEGCRNDQMGLHRHPGMHLGHYADEVEAGGMT